jgi:cation transport ATPase
MEITNAKSKLLMLVKTLGSFPMIAKWAMTFSSVPAIMNALRLDRVEL